MHENKGRFVNDKFGREEIEKRDEESINENDGAWRK